MAPFVRIECPKCGVVFDVTRMVFDEGPRTLIYCPLCTTRWPRDEAKVLDSNFPLAAKE